MSEEFVPSPEFLARNQRLNDAIQLKQLDRIPIILGLGYLLAEMGGITRQQLRENPAQAQEITEKLALQFQADAVFGVYGDPEPSRILDDRMTKAL